KYNIDEWVNIYMRRLGDLKKMQLSMKTGRAKDSIRDNIMRSYDESKQRRILLDYDGTLVGFKKQIDQASPDPELNSLMEKFSSDHKNHTVIISGRKHETLELWFGNRNLELIAEHGAWRKKLGGEWEQKPDLASTWKEEVHQLMDAFCDRTPGSFVEEKSYSLVWHYRKVQKGLGSLRANELMDNLRYMIAAYGLQLLNGHKVVEVKNAEINKGRATYSLLNKDDMAHDFILAIGDDYTDEDIFKALPESAYTIKVGN